MVGPSLHYENPQIENNGGVGTILLHRNILLGMNRQDWEQVRIEVGKVLLFPKLDFSGIESPLILAISTDEIYFSDISIISVQSISFQGGEILQILRQGNDNYKICPCEVIGRKEKTTAQIAVA